MANNKIKSKSDGRHNGPGRHGFLVNGRDRKVYLDDETVEFMKSLSRNKRNLSEGIRNAKNILKGKS